MNRKIVVVATVALLFSVLVSEAHAQDQQPEVLWTQEVGQGVRFEDPGAIQGVVGPSIIKVGDLNGDSKPDLVVEVTDPPSIVAIDSGGAVLWRLLLNAICDVAVGEIDGDGRDDVVANDCSSLRAISGSGAELWRAAVPGVVEIGDVTGDGRNEVIVGADDLVVLDNQGSELLRVAAPAVITAMALADVIGDDQKEMFISYGSVYSCPAVAPDPYVRPCGVQVIDGSGHVVWNIPTANALAQPVVGDLNGDGKADVVVRELGEYGGTHVEAIDSSGSLLWTFAYGSPLFGNVVLAVGDIDDTGSPDVALGDGGQAGPLYVLDAEGHVKWTFNTGSPIYQVAVGDLDGDGTNEVVASTIGPASNTGIFAFNSDGSERWFFPESSEPRALGYSDLAIADLDNDGRAEVLAIQPFPSPVRLIALSTPAAEITVDIDIKPGGVKNRINARSRGKIPVAILSSPTFDVMSEVDTHSLTFGRTGDETSLVFCNSADVNGDGLLDALCHFNTEAADFRAGDTQAVLKGETRAGVPIKGSDSVRIVRGASAKP